MAAKEKKAIVEFNANDFVVYPTHGVGRILGTETQTIAGFKMDVLIVRFEQDRMTLRVPLEKARSLGLRTLSSKKTDGRSDHHVKGQGKITP
jgi:CarD family transcriptional regulator